MVKHEWENIGCYAYPNAYIYADRTKIEDGSYQEVARVLKCPAKIQYRNGHEIPAELKKDAESCLQNIWDEIDKSIGYEKFCTVLLFKHFSNDWTVHVMRDASGYRDLFHGMSDANADRIKAECAKRGCECRVRLLLQ